MILVIVFPAHASELNCHLHVPVDLKEFSHLPTIIPDLEKPQECERVNARRLGSKGRCHCSFAGAGPGIGIGSEFRQYVPADTSVEDGRPDWLQ